MPIYKVPVRDMQFVLHEVWNCQQQLSGIPAFAEVTPDLIDAVLEEAAKIHENVLFPLNHTADQEGCRLDNGKVTTPKGFKEAYRLYCEGGWTALRGETEFGGQGFPQMVGLLVEEMLSSSNISFSLYVGLTHGVCNAIDAHASHELKQKYLPKMIAGTWTGAMCLTESHCGSDLGLVRTKAELQNNGTYHLNGTKIFITAGEHDLAENIIHLVLARTPDAPAGVKGLSLFLVPKFLVNAEGTLGKFNGINCGAIEHKMGIKGSATCVINYDNAEGYLVGNLNQGMMAMFTVMNVERLAIGLQGLALAEVSYQNARNYAQERLQGRDVAGIKYPDKMADPIIVHPDVRRMLLTMKAYNEGARALMVWVAMQVDKRNHTDSNIKNNANNLVEFFTPIVKAFFTDYGFEACNLGVQVLGGHGYIAEWGMEQYVRDARIAQIYEGTNGIQAQDLIRRKLIANQGEFLQSFTHEVETFIQQHTHQQNLKSYLEPLSFSVQQLKEITQWILNNHQRTPYEFGAAAVDYLQVVSLVSFAYMWARMAAVAQEKINSSEKDFYQTKLATAEFFMQKLLPKVDSLIKIIKAGSTSIMALSAERF